jgi:hypothetical protein
MIHSFRMIITNNKARNISINTMAKISMKHVEKSKPISNVLVKKLNKVALGFIPDYNSRRSNKIATSFQSIHSNGYAKRDSRKDSIECAQEIASCLKTPNTTAKVSCSVLLPEGLTPHTFMLTHKDEHLICTDISADGFYAESNYSYRVIVDTAADLLGLPIIFFDKINDETGAMYTAICSHIDSKPELETVCSHYCQAVINTGILHKLNINGSKSSGASSSINDDNTIIIDLLNA